jgi:hypothetical protein
MKKCKNKPRQIEYVSRESIYRSIGKEMPGLLKPGSNISAIVETVNKIADIVEEDAEMMECNFNDDEETAEITGTGNTSYETKMPCGEGIHVPPIAERDAELLQIQLRHGFSNAATAAIARYMHIFRCLLKNRILIWHFSWRNAHKEEKDDVLCDIANEKQKIFSKAKVPVPGMLEAILTPQGCEGFTAPVTVRKVAQKMLELLWPISTFCCFFLPVLPPRHGADNYITLAERSSNKNDNIISARHDDGRGKKSSSILSFFFGGVCETHRRTQKRRKNTTRCNHSVLIMLYWLDAYWEKHERHSKTIVRDLA